MERAAGAHLVVILAAVLSLGTTPSEAIAGGAHPARGLTVIGSGGVDAEVLSVLVVPRSQGRRGVIMEFRARERITVELRVIRYQSIVARTKTFNVRPGRWLTTLSLPANAGAGRARVLVRLQDRAGHIAWYRQLIRIPARGH